MPIQSSMFSKRPITVMTFEWPLPCVHSLMTEQWPFLSESSATKWTNIRQDAGVSSQVNLHGILKIKSQHDYHHNLFNLKRETYTYTKNTVVPSSEIMYCVPVHIYLHLFWKFCDTLCSWMVGPWCGFWDVPWHERFFWTVSRTDHT